MSLLLVNRQIGREARDAFFEVNVIRLSEPEDKLLYLDDLRDVELTGEIACRIWDDAFEPDVYSSIKTFIARPKIRSLTIATDFLVQPWRRLRYYLVDRIDPRCSLCCWGFGIFQLRTPIKTRARIYFEHYGLTSALQEARVLASIFPPEELNDMVEESDRTIGIDDTVTLEEAHSCILAHWLSCFEVMRIWETNPHDSRLRDGEIEAAQSFIQEYEEYVDADLTVRHELPAGVGFLGLEDFQGEYEGWLDEWASDVLSIYSAYLERYLRRGIEINRIARRGMAPEFRVTDE